MKSLPRTIVAVLTIGLLTGGFSSPTQAAPIQGSIDFGGVVTFDTMSLATATRVNTWDSSIVLQDSGDFATFVSAGSNATMAAPWIFNPSTVTPSLWSVGGFTFDLASSIIITQTTQFLDIRGAGTISGHGFDPTAGTWSFTSTKSDGEDSATFGFQAQTSPVPEASSVVLLMVGAFTWLSARFLRRKLLTS